MDSKSTQIRLFIERQVKEAILLYSGEMFNRQTAEVLRLEARIIAQQAGCRVSNGYAFLELADIMEWKRTRVRR